MEIPSAIDLLFKTEKSESDKIDKIRIMKFFCHCLSPVVRGNGWTWTFDPKMLTWEFYHCAITAGQDNVA
jgi:hypothetical protein